MTCDAVTGYAGALSVGWWHWMVGVCWQVSLLIVVLTLLDRCLARRVWPELLSALWSLSLIKLALPPWWVSPLGLSERLPSGIIPANVTVAANSLFPIIALFVWLGGVAVIACYAVARNRSIRREWLHNARPLPDVWQAQAVTAGCRLGMARLPRVCASFSAPVPAVIGCWKPIIVIPQSLLRADRVRSFELAMLHELTHVARRDPWLALAAQLAQLVYWFHPLVWLVRVRLATLREIACDVRVVGLTRDHRSYAEMLLALAEKPGRTSWIPESALLRRRSQLIERLQWLITCRGPAARWQAGGIVLVAALVGTVALPMAGSPIAQSPIAQALPRNPPMIRHTTMVSTITESFAPNASTDEPGCFRQRFRFYEALASERNSTAKTY